MSDIDTWKESTRGGGGGGWRGGDGWEERGAGGLAFSTCNLFRSRTLAVCTVAVMLRLISVGREVHNNAMCIRVSLSVSQNGFEEHPPESTARLRVDKNKSLSRAERPLPLPLPLPFHPYFRKGFQAVARKAQQKQRRPRTKYNEHHKEGPTTTALNRQYLRCQYPETIKRYGQLTRQAQTAICSRW